MKVKIYYLFVLVFLVSCTQKTEYQKMEETALLSGERVDSLFMGVHLGMDSKVYFDHCLAMNKLKKFTHGGGNGEVDYMFEDGSPDFRTKTRMSFAPQMYDDKIYKLTARFQYTDWAPWNKEAHSGPLILEVKKLLEKWYGGTFIKVKHPKYEVGYAKIDGNRKVTIEQQDEQYVLVSYTDLFKEKELERK